MTTEFSMVCKTNHQDRIHSNVAITLKRSPPLSRELKLNTDGFTMANPWLGGLGGTFKNTNGDWVLGYYQYIPHTTPTMAEIFAIRAGLLIAKEHNLRAFEIKIDSSAAITILINNHPPLC
ncbi:hypothetical protein P3L10_002303 [Capsicum annuum]